MRLAITQIKKEMSEGEDSAGASVMVKIDVIKMLSCTDTKEVSSHPSPEQEVKRDPFSLI